MTDRQRLLEMLKLYDDGTLGEIIKARKGEFEWI